MQLTKHFTLEELFQSPTALAHGIDNEPDLESAFNLSRLAGNILEPLRLYLNTPLRINSGYRCKALNDILPGSAPNSNHLKGLAADITWNGFHLTCHQVVTFLKCLPCTNEVILYRARHFIHVSLKPNY